MELYNSLETCLGQHLKTISLTYQGLRYDLYNAQRDPETFPELVLKDHTFKFRDEGQLHALISHCNAIGLIHKFDGRVLLDYLKNHSLESLVSALELAAYGYTYITNKSAGNRPTLVTTRLTFYSIVTYDDFVSGYNQNIPIGKVYTTQGQGFIYRNTAWDIVIIVKDYFDTLKVPFFDTGNLTHRQIIQPEHYIPHGNGYGMSVIDTESKPCVSDVHLYDVCPIRIRVSGRAIAVKCAEAELDAVLSAFPSKASEIYPTIDALVKEYDVQFSIYDECWKGTFLGYKTVPLFVVFIEMMTSVHLGYNPAYLTENNIVISNHRFNCETEADKLKVIQFLLDNEIIEDPEVCELATVDELIDALLLRATLVGLKKLTLYTL